jgi:rhamnogalacturonyl hydrolase YesR
MKTIRAVVSCVAVVTALALRAAEPALSAVIRDDLTFATAQYDGMLQHIQGKSGLPRSFAKNEIVLSRANEWTSGFFAGGLWFLYENTHEAKWKDAAVKYSALLEQEKDNRKTHDVGFILYCSYGQGLRLTGDPHYRDVLATGAQSLSTRFNPKVGAIKSWDNRREWAYPVIIDNMMNLELLFWTAREMKQPALREIALAHADTTLRNHYRPDGSSYHVVDYDPDTGAVRHRQTHQGAADDSAWARGQAWGLYGFTLCYRESQRPEYLAQAKKIAAFLMTHPRMPADKVPYWDFDAKDIPNAPRDASAAAIMSSALIELSGFVEPALAKTYLAFAEQQLRSLSSPAYRPKVGDNGYFLLEHSVGNLPAKSEIDVPIIYADYYFLEALTRYQALLAKSGR